MAGLNLGAGAQVKVGSQATYGTVAGPTSAYAAGFGYDDGGNSGGQGIGALAPTHPAGISFWYGVLSVSLLVLLYHSLPK